MTISDQGYAAMQAMEAGDRAEVRAIKKALAVMVVHLHEHHKMGEKKIAQELGVHRFNFVRMVLKERKRNRDLSERLDQKSLLSRYSYP